MAFILLADPIDMYDELEVYAVCSSKEIAHSLKTKAKVGDSARYYILRVGVPLFMRQGLFCDVVSGQKKATILFGRGDDRSSVAIDIDRLYPDGIDPLL